ncbi:MAG TPA: hypothetical protein VFQ38_04025 [Longimicrobiales bacterium]|nr:hypothetical protein [Longimicrobiales bacterium]
MIRRLTAVSALAVLAAACAEAPTAPVRSAPRFAQDQTGNGAPSGGHYNLNIIGVPRNKTADMTGDNGRRIFVDLGAKGAVANSKIYLYQSFDGSFGVLDANGTDGYASFKLPAPGTYQIYARYLGKPGGHADMTTCVDDDGDPATTGDIYCSTGAYVSGTVTTGKGSKQFENVTTALTTLTLDATAQLATGCSANIDIFDPCAEGYLWSYDNQGLKLMQLRFYTTTS